MGIKYQTFPRSYSVYKLKSCPTCCPHYVWWFNMLFSKIIYNNIGVLYLVSSY